MSVVGPGDWTYVELSLGQHRTRALLDTGASRTILRRSEFNLICKTLGRTPILSKTINLCAVTGHPIKVLGSTEINEAQLGPISVIVVEGIQHACILGRDVLKDKQAVIDYQNGALICHKATFPLIPTAEHDYVESFGPRPPQMDKDIIRRCVNEYEHIFAAKGESLGCHPDIAVRIITEGPPFKRRPYRIPFKRGQL